MNDGEEVIPFEVNLVHFDPPEVVINKPVSTSTKQGKSAEKCFDSLALVSSGDGLIITGLEFSDVLNRILPPREWQKDGKFFREKISKQPATKLEVKKLGEKLDTYLEKFKAREVGICPIKRQLYNQCFNEIIRQETLICAERGYILLRLRDEINININAYQDLYESILAKGIRKAFLEEQGKSYLEKKTEQLTSENEKLEIELAEIKRKTESTEREMAKAREEAIKSQNIMLDQLKKANQAIKAQLELIVAPKK